MIKDILLVAVGAAIGSVIAWQVLDRKYRKIADEGVKSAKEYYKEKYEVFLGESVGLPDEFAVVEDENGVVQDITTVPSKDSDNVIHWAKKLKEESESSFTDYTAMSKANQDLYLERKETKMSGIRMVTQEEFDNCMYDVESYTKYGDGTIADEVDKPVEDVDDIFGEDLLEEMESINDDAIYFIDEDREIAYEVLVDPRPYRELPEVMIDD